jgi:hypothetical protein
MNAQVAELTALWSELRNVDYNGYGVQSIPSPLDAKFQRLVGVFSRLSPAERERVYTLSPIPPFALLAFSERMASLAVRERSQTELFLGLMGLVLEGFRHDPRESMLILALHNDAAARIGADTTKVFAEASVYAPMDVARQLTNFVLRNPEKKSIVAMGYDTVGESSTFRYKRTW